jgi:hypothetical protein
MDVTEVTDLSDGMAIVYAMIESRLFEDNYLLEEAIYGII